MVEEAHRVAEGMVVEVRAALSLLETVRDAAHSELLDAQQLIIVACSLFHLSLASRAGPPALTTMNSIVPFQMVQGSG